MADSNNSTSSSNNAAAFNRWLRISRRKRELKQEKLRAVVETQLAPPNPKRPRREQEEMNNDGNLKSKKERSRPKIEEELICPISHHLPFEPVMAMDGRIYEKSSIEEYFESKEGQDMVTSPITGEIITKKLLPAVQIKNTIEASIANGYITGELALAWKDTAKEKERAEKWLKEAEGGDVSKMELVADSYYNGVRGFKLDCKSGFMWYDKARIAGSLVGLTAVGNILHVGLPDVEKDEKRGFMYICLSAKGGSNQAAYWLGMALADGQHGLAANTAEAIYWLEKSLDENCTARCMSHDAKVKARKKLDELLQRSSIGAGDSR